MIHNIDLCQWDVGRTLTISDSEATHIHFANQGDSYAAIMNIDNGSVLIPNYLLETGKTLIAYAVKKGENHSVTLESKTFAVRKRERPADYVYEEDRRNYIYELIENAESAINIANEAADRANEAASKASEYSGDVESIKNELDNLRYDYEGNECESAGEAVRGADITLNTKIQEVSDIAHNNAVEISILQETVENINPGGGGITDEELTTKVTEIIVADIGEGGSISEAVGDAAANEATWVSEMMMEQHGLLLWDAENGEYTLNVPTYEELPQKMADAILSDYEEEIAGGSLAGAIDMIAWSSAYSAAENYLQDSGVLSTDAYDDETGLPIRNVPTYEELEEAVAGPQYELVRSVTTSGELTISIEGIALDAFALFVEAPAGTEAKGGTVTIVKGNKTVWSPWVNNAVITASASHFAVYGKNEKGLAFLEYTDATGSTATQKKYVNRAPFFVEGNTPFTRVSFNCSALPAGTKAELWGIVKQNYLAEE